jgi:Protein of unknown function (DUF3891)
MIRRDDRGDWLIVDQIEHARLAAEVARVWAQAPLFTGSYEHLRETVDEIRDLFGEHSEWFVHHPDLCIWLAVAEHDDGWRDWDRAPRINPTNGSPREFREMRIADSSAIWSLSISCCSAPPLGNYAISRHFCFLAQQCRDGSHAGEEDRQAADRFLHEQANVQSQLALDAAAQGWGDEFDHCRELAYRTVQFFDRVSLWLCCSQSTEPESMTTPAGETVDLVPRSLREAGQSCLQVGIRPYPLCVESLDVSVPARRIAARRYVNDADLHRALAEARLEKVAWKIGPT